MARRGVCIIYDHTHNVKVSRAGFAEERRLNIHINEVRDIIGVKLRDLCDFVFNYFIDIDERYFESMRNEQNLDINFLEFKTNLIEMLEQVEKEEMYLKCDIASSDRCRLMFYGQSKIKAIVYLVIDLHAASQKEIFDEMNRSILELQSVNKNLSSQIQLSRKLLQDKDSQIRNSTLVVEHVKKQFLSELQKLSMVFSQKHLEVSTKLVGEILIKTRKLDSISRDVDVVKAEMARKSSSSARLLESMESLRVESIETSRLITELRRENAVLKSAQNRNGNVIEELERSNAEKGVRLDDVLKKKDELEKDIKQATIIIAQRTAANEELAKDVVQANQMLVNFNNLYENKNKEIEDLHKIILEKDATIQEHNRRFQSMRQEFEEYRAKYNPNEHGKLKQELAVANKRIEEVDKLNRENGKLNELLTRKLASGEFMQQPHRTYR